MATAWTDEQQKAYLSTLEEGEILHPEVTRILIDPDMLERKVERAIDGRPGLWICLAGPSADKVEIDGPKLDRR
jgi:hypothetical protein